MSRNAGNHDPTALSKSEMYKNFRSWVGLQKLICDDKEWQFYDYGPKNVPPLLFIPGAQGTADVFYKQFVSLSSHGYRLVSIQYPPLWTHGEWVKAFDRFLDLLHVDKVHIFGASLGGYLALCFTQYRPQRVLSLILCTSFIDTHHFHRHSAWVSMLPWMPTFVLQRMLLADLPRDAVAIDEALAIDFLVEQLERLSHNELAARLALTTQDNYIRTELIRLAPEQVLVLDTFDDKSSSAALREEVTKLFPASKTATLKSGGSLPYLANSPELNLHIQIHLRQQQEQVNALPSPPAAAAAAAVAAAAVVPSTAAAAASSSSTAK